MKQKYKIINGVATPKKRNRESKYPFGQMRIGNAFNAGEYSIELQRSLVSLLNHWKKSNGTKAHKFKSWKTAKNELIIKRLK